MKVGFARRGYSGTGGAEAYLKRFAAALTAEGHETCLYASEPWPELEWTGTRLEVVPGRTPRRYADAMRSARCDYLFSMERIWQCDCYRAGDGVHRVWLERRRAMEPFWRSWGRVFNGKHRELLQLEAQLFSPDGAGVVIANSHMVRGEIAQHYGYPVDRIHVVYNGVPERLPAGEQERKRLREELGIAQGTPVFLFAGSGWERKGLTFAIEAMKAARLRDGVLLVAGRGNPRGMPSCDQVRFLGPVHGLARYYAMADVFVLPTLYDPFSNASLEAFVAGLPVITTRYNGFSEVITPEEEGSIVNDPADIPTLAAAFRTWADPDRCRELRPRLYARAGQFTIAENLRQTLEVMGVNGAAVSECG